MPKEQELIKNQIKSKVIELAINLGKDAAKLQFDEVLPETGYLDSAGIIELLAWLEDNYNITIKNEEITIDNFGTINAITNSVIKITNSLS